MAHFYGVLEGSARTPATRCGTKNSGLTAIAASWDGAIETYIWYDETIKKNRYQVRQKPWHGQGISKTLSEGIIGDGN